MAQIDTQADGTITEEDVFDWLDAMLPPEVAESTKSMLSTILDLAAVDAGQDGGGLEEQPEPAAPRTRGVPVQDDGLLDGEVLPPARGRGRAAPAAEEDLGLDETAGLDEADLLPQDEFGAADDSGLVDDGGLDDGGELLDVEELAEQPAPRARGRAAPAAAPAAPARAGRAAPAPAAPARAGRAAPAAAPAAPARPKKITFASLGVKNSHLKSAAGELAALKTVKAVKDFVVEQAGVEISSTRREDVVADATQIMAVLYALDSEGAQEPARDLLARLKAAGVAAPDLKGARTAPDQRKLLLTELILAALDNAG